MPKVLLMVRLFFDRTVWSGCSINPTLEAFRQGEKEPAQEMKLLFKPWGFNLEKITCPITVWHGALDTQVPLSHAKIYANLISHATLKKVPDEGHHSILKNHMAEIMCSIVSTSVEQARK
ncbi:MAG: alpha/beta hydrolase [Legionellales bacterium]|nr:alpha/beta hydrolase [Legionellales bacterium]